MTFDDLFDRLRRMIEEICALPPDTVQRRGRLLGYQLDSARALELIVAIEDGFGLELEKDVLLEVQTMDELCKLVERALEERGMAR